MKVLLLPNQIKEEALALMPILEEKLIASGHEPLYDGTDLRPDVVLFMGGDGTFIHYAPSALTYDVPYGGINVGNFGYLTNCSADDAAKWLEGLHEYDHDDCLILEAEGAYIINDVTFKARRNIETFRIYDGDRLISTIRASGLIVATPLGSTGINRSAGGPILDLSLEDIVITPILSLRKETPPLVYHIRRSLTIKSDEPSDHTIDGKKTETASSFTIRNGSKKLKKINMVMDRR